MWFGGLLDAPVAPLALLDRLLNAAMPSWLALITWGVLVGALWAAIYWRMAPEARIGQIRADAATARRALNDLADDTEFGVALALAWKSIRLSLNEMSLVTGPAVAACAPGICKRNVALIRDPGISSSHAQGRLQLAQGRYD